MSSPDLRARLHADLDDAIRRLARLNGDAPERADHKGGGEDVDMDAVTGAESAELLHRHRAALLVRVSAIRRAMGRVDSGAYGRCVLCGGEVAAKRLEAIPEAEHCRDCAAEIERAAVAVEPGG